MEALHQHLVGRQHVIDLTAGGLGRDRLVVVEGMPARMPGEQERRVGDVSLDVHRRRARRDDVRRMAGRVAGRADRVNAGDHVLIPFIGPQALHDLGIRHYPVDVLEIIGDALRRRTALLAGIGPVFVLERRHEDFGIREGD
jgi:hypothetical protein